MNKNCPLCHSITEIKAGSDQFFIKELQSGYILLCHHQFYKGYLLFLYKEHKNELHELSLKERELYLMEMSLVAEAIHMAFKPKKINYELLGNTVSHLHWHLIPRYVGDPNLLEPIWSTNSNIRRAEEYRPSLSEIALLKDKIISALNQIIIARKQ